MTRYQLLVNDWRDCTRCHLSTGRLKVVMARGSLPCDVFFTGEAPGESENVVGRPFIGPAGDLLDHVISRSVPPGVTYAIGNVCGCIPRLGDGNKAAEPDDEAIEACRPRLETLLDIARPRLVVAVGSLARDWLYQGYKHSIKFPPSTTTVVDIHHPAFVLRSTVAARGLLIQKMVVTVRAAIEDLNLGGAGDADAGS